MKLEKEGIILIILSILLTANLVQSVIPNSAVQLDAEQKNIVWAYLDPIGAQNSPMDAKSVYTKDYASSIYNGLLRRTISSDKEYVPDLAANMPIVSNDYKNWTFTLRPGLKFSDGSDLNASSIVFSYKVALTASIDSSYERLAPYFINSSVTEIDNLTITFNMTKPFAFAPGLFTTWIYSPSIFSPRANDCWDGNIIACNFNTDLTGNNWRGGSGPFMMDKYDTSNNIVELVPNPEYYMYDQIKIDRIVFRTIVDATAAKAAFAIGETNIFDSQYKARSIDFVSLASISDVFVGAPGVQELVPNHLHPYFGTGNYTTSGTNAKSSNVDSLENARAARSIRKAMSHMVDRVFVADESTGGLGAPAATIMPTISIGWDETLLPRVYDIDIAKRYMEDAGFDYTGKTIDDSTGALDEPFFEITIMSPTGAVDRHPWASFLAIELPKIGIGIKQHVTSPFSSMYTRTFDYPSPPPEYDKGGYDVFFVGWSFSMDFDPTGLYEVEYQNPNCCNVYNYNNITTETAIKDYIAEMDAASRLPMVKRVQELLYDDQPSIPIVNTRDHWAWANQIIGLDALSMSQRIIEWELVDMDFTIAGVRSVITKGGTTTATTTQTFYNSPITTEITESISNLNLNFLKMSLFLTTVFVIILVRNRKKSMDR